jgi:HEAT repeat protein
MARVGISVTGVFLLGLVAGSTGVAAQQGAEPDLASAAVDASARPGRASVPARPDTAQGRWQDREGSSRQPRVAQSRTRSVVESERLARAKDLMSDDQWVAAIAVLRAAAADVREPNRDEALFWLAHSQNQAGHLAEAVESIRRLQREHEGSRWTRPAHSLLLELAQKLGRRDVLWWTAVPPPPPPPAPPAGAVAAAPPPPPPPPPPAPWVSVTRPDVDLRVQALGSLMQTEALKAIPLLRSIAMESDNAGAARRAVFVLAQSRHPDAQTTVIDVARRGPEPVRIAAVRELGRFGGPEIAGELLQVYTTANAPVKWQVVAAFGERQDAVSLLKIAESETDGELRNAAIITLGRAGAREPLRLLYAKAQRGARRAVIIGLFNARDEQGLIGIAQQEKDVRLRAEALSRLRLLGTPAARAYLDEHP